MVPDNREHQLELFDLSNQPVARLQRETFGRLLIHLRYDQLVLGGIATLLGVTVVFACGVERGKQLVRGERMMVARQQPAASDQKTAPAAPEQKAAVEPHKAEKKTPSTPEAPAKATGKGASRYAVQVVTYSRPTLAKREMERLKARGERVFLVMRDGRTMVYVGPFPSKVNASEKLTSLRPHYQDCFIKPL